MTHPSRRLVVGSAVTVAAAFTLLGFMGREIYRKAPPIPARVTAEDGQLLMTENDILTGQQVWQSTGGQQLGSVWGHGAYQAPDWSADWLHRESQTLLHIWANREHGTTFDALPIEAAAGLQARLVTEMRTNRYDPLTGTLILGADRAEAMRRTAQHYRSLFSTDIALSDLREDYAMREGTVTDPGRLDALVSFFFWTSWACTTERPGSSVTYTNNWPHEPLVENDPSPANVLWSVASIVLLLAVLGGFVWYRAFRPENEPPIEPPRTDPLLAFHLTPSMRAVWKYLVVVIALFVVQVGLGAVTAHYTVEGQAFFGFPLADYLPYALTRTWHIQTAMFWIATAFLAAGLFLAPAIGGQEPRGQRLGVNVLFGALLVVVTGSLAGELLSIHQRLGLDQGFWFGHQGYEYVDLGRAWQIGLFVGLLLWLFLMIRALAPALKRRDEARPLTLLFAGSTTAIGLMYAAGFFFGARTHLSVMEYWRWWVVHLWVEGFFEVFATAALAFIFAKLGLVRASHAATAVLASTTLFLIGGIPGTLHHLYFSGTPTPVMAVGAVFSALEVVPLILIGFEAYQTSRKQEAAPWMRRYRWPIRFFVAVAFWESGGRRHLRVPHQPPTRPLLPPGPQHHAGPRSHRSVRGVRAPFPRVRFAHRPSTRWGRRVERASSGLVVLGPQRRPHPDGRLEPPSHRHHPGDGQRRAWDLVRPERGPSPATAGGHLPLAAYRRRRRLPLRGRPSGLVPGWEVVPSGRATDHLVGGPARGGSLMKRDRRLHGLSSDHHGALVLARTIRDTPGAERPGLLPTVRARFDQELLPHFRAEEELLLPALRDAGHHELVARTLSDHRDLAHYLHAAEDEPEALRTFADLLTQHVRFEEEELFPTCELVLTPEGLDAVAVRVPHPRNGGPV